MESFSREEKERIIKEIQALEERLGSAPLTNVRVVELTPDDVDIVAVGALILDRKNRPVLVRRAETPNEWLIPGGTVDPGEELLSTAVREAREETGLETRVEALLRVGLVRDYGPEAFREVNRSRFGRERVNLLFINFRSRALSGSLDGSRDPSSNILEVAAFDELPFDKITHVYKTLFVHERLYPGDPSAYPPVEFEPGLAH